MSNLTDNILFWYKQNKRVLPWRRKKDSKNPYYVWLSEIMLQQTNVGTVRKYYKKFITRWPTMNDLSEAKLDDILLIWQGLGFYNRAINLHKCSKIVCRKYNGKLPNSFKLLNELPGIGEYTANAILAIAFNKRTIGVDINVNRIISRLFNLTNSDKNNIQKKINNLLPNKKCGDFMQAIMDIGATICKKNKIECFICPLKKNCSFYKERKDIKLNLRKKLKKKFLFVYLIKYKNMIVLKKRKKTKFLNGLMEIPNTLVENKFSSIIAKKNAPIKLNWKSIPGKLNTKISNFDLEIRFFKANVNYKVSLKNGEWVNRCKINNMPMSSMMKNVLSYLNLI